MCNILMLIKHRAMKELKEMISLWKHDVSWEKMDAKKKKTCLEFGLVASLVLFVSNSWLILPALVIGAKTVKALSDIEIDE